jgi:hypothetical protein
VSCGLELGLGGEEEGESAIPQRHRSLQLEAPLLYSSTSSSWQGTVTTRRPAAAAAAAQTLAIQPTAAVFPPSSPFTPPSPSILQRPRRCRPHIPFHPTPHRRERADRISPHSPPLARGEARSTIPISSRATPPLLSVDLGHLRRAGAHVAPPASLTPHNCAFIPPDHVPFFRDLGILDRCISGLGNERRSLGERSSPA